jgi:hypothetical protein
MKKADLDLYSDYLLSTFGAATATGLSAMVEGDVPEFDTNRHNYLISLETVSKFPLQQAQLGGCKNFCVNGLLAGNCRTSRKKRNDRKQRSYRQPAG